MSDKLSRSRIKTSVAKWLTEHISVNYEQVISEVVIDANLAMLPQLRGYSNHSQLKFKIDVVGILRSKSSDEVTLILVNVMDDKSSIGLKQILAMRMMCQAAKPVEALLLSTDGLSRPVQTMMYSRKRDRKALQYDGDKCLELWRFDAITSQLDGDCPIMPLSD